MIDRRMENAFATLVASQRRVSSVVSAVVWNSRSVEKMCGEMTPKTRWGLAFALSLVIDLVASGLLLWLTFFKHDVDGSTANLVS